MGQRSSRETGDLLLWQHGPIHFRHTLHIQHHFAWVPLGVHMVEVGTLLAIAYVVFRPLAAPRALPGRALATAAPLAGRALRSRHAVVLQAPSRQALLLQRRADRVRRLPDRERACCCCPAIRSGPRPRLPGVARATAGVRQRPRAEARCVGASRADAPAVRGLGLRTIYLGDEAIIEPARSRSRGGRSARSANRSPAAQGRLQRRAATARRAGRRRRRARWRTCSSAGARAPPSAASRWRWTRSAGRRGRGHAARARPGRADGAIRGVLHFVPCYGRPAVSLSFMRRDPETPNGLTEFLVVRRRRAAARARGSRRCR